MREQTMSERIKIGAAAAVLLLLFGLAVASGCEGMPRYPPQGVEHHEQREPKPRTGEPRQAIEQPTATDIAEAGAEAVRVAEPAVREGRVNPDTAEEVGETLAPILNPLTGGWFSAALGLGLFAWRTVQSVQRGEMLQAVDDDPDTPPAADQVGKVRPDLRGKAQKVTRRR